MSGIVSLEITSNATDFPYEKKMPEAMKLLDFKKKLELVVGAVAEQMSVELRDCEGKFVATLSDDCKSLAALGVKDGMRIHIIDKSGWNEELKDGSMIEKYEMDEKEYDKRTDSVRAFKKKMLAEHREDGIAPSEQMRQGEDSQATSHIKLGDRCRVNMPGTEGRRCGRVMYNGETKFKKGIWIGIQYDEPVGKNNGSVGGVRYFDCNENHGGFVRPHAVEVGDFPESTGQEEMEEI